MCGIHGYLGNIPFSNNAPTKAHFRDSVKDGFVANMLRGVHSSGMFAIPDNREKEVPVVKRAYNGLDFLGVQDAKSLFDAYSDMFGYVAHLRWATKGNIHRDNAHPFQHGPITMVHNGTLLNEKDLGNWNFATDSEYICKSLAEREDPRETIKLLNGAFALVWHDRRTNKMYMTRNGDRELSYAYVKNKNALLFASEWPMMQWLGWRNYIDLEEIEDVTPYDILEFPVDNPRGRIITKADAYVAPPSKWANWNKRSDSRSGGAVTDIPFIKTPVVVMMASGGNGVVPKEVPPELQPGKEVVFSVMELFLSKKVSRNGTLEGVMVDAPGWRVVARNIDLRKFSGTKRMKGTVAGWLCLGSVWPTVYVGNVEETNEPDVDKNGKVLGYNRHYKKYKEAEQNPVLLNKGTGKVKEIRDTVVKLAPFLDEERDPDEVLAEVRKNAKDVNDMEWVRTVTIDGIKMIAAAAERLLTNEKCAWCGGDFQGAKDMRFVSNSWVCDNTCGPAIPFLKHGINKED